MKIELDENLPIRLVPLLIDLGHNVETVPDEQIAGRDHHVAWTAAQADGRFLVTQISTSRTRGSIRQRRITLFCWSDRRSLAGLRSSKGSPHSFGRRPLTVGTVVSSRQLTGRSASRDLNDMVVVAASIDRYSPSATKIKLFRSLFRGREDVYPRRFESRKTDAILRAINRRGGSPSVPVDIIPRS